MVNKNDIRQKILQARLQLDMRQVKEKSVRVYNNLINHFKLNSEEVGIYCPIKNEVDIFTHFKVAEYPILLPCLEDDSLLFRRWKDGDSLVSKNGFLQPLGEFFNPKIIIVPMVAFDEQGYRIGYGKGHYDKFLVNSGALKIGVAFEMQKVQSIPYEEFDIPMNFIVTEKQVYKFYLDK